VISMVLMTPAVAFFLMGTSHAGGDYASCFGGAGGHGPWEMWLAAWLAQWRLRSCGSEFRRCARRHQVVCWESVHDGRSADVVQPTGSFGLANRR